MPEHIVSESKNQEGGSVVCSTETKLEPVVIRLNQGMDPTPIPSFLPTSYQASGRIGGTRIRMEFLRQINHRTKNELLRIVQIWIAFVSLSKIALIFPHWNISKIALFNYDLFFLMLLLAARIFLKKHDNRYVYLNLAVFATVYVAGFLGIFLGKDYAIGNDFFQYYYYVYRKIAIGIITCITIIFIVIEFLFHELKLQRRYAAAIFLTLPFSYFNFRNFFLDSNYLFRAQNNYIEVFSGLLAMNFLALFFILLYGYLKIRLERPIIGHVNVIVFGFLLFLSIDSIDNFHNLIQRAVPPLSQIFLVLNLLYFIAVLAHNYLYLNTEFGRFMLDILFGRRKVSVRLLHRRSYIERYFLIIQEFFKNFPYQIFFKMFMAISILLFLKYYPYGYFKMSFAVLILLTMAMIVYLNALIKKRSKTNALNIKKR